MATDPSSAVSATEFREAVDLVRGFLGLVEARDLESAEAFLAAEVTITFPGGREFKNLRDQVASSGGRFRSVVKSFDHFDVAGGVGEFVVYAVGTLSGLALDGSAFDSVRFIDRFTLRDGLITTQKVWNDLGELGLVGAPDYGD